MDLRTAPAPDKTTSEVAQEWDQLSTIRQDQIDSGKDLTFHKILVPNIMGFLSGSNIGKVLDVGCGIGKLTSILSENCSEVVGIDPSAKSIAVAQAYKLDNMNFVVSTAEDYANICDQKFDAIVANMVLMDVLNLDYFLEALRKLISPNGLLVFSITHPFFWPKYYGYDSALWFHYEDEIIIESPFRISASQKSDMLSTHVHRPISRYLNSLRSAGFLLQAILEPMPDPEIMKLYEKEWLYPRYIFGACKASDRFTRPVAPASGTED